MGDWWLRLIKNIKDSGLTDRRFLFLQGPHGPFFSDLAGLLKQAGCSVHRIGFNAGDAHFWKHKQDYTPFTESVGEWRSYLQTFFKDSDITDLILYGDTRAIHATACEEARAHGIRVHCFEEGYLRPYWITYELDGVNGHSPLMNMSVEEMRSRMGGERRDLPEAPAQWGALWHHIYLGALYHFRVLFQNRKYRNYRPHRAISVRREWWLYIKRLMMFPLTGYARKRDARLLETSGANYHLVLLQLAHDSSFIEHSDFDNIKQFIDLCCESFAVGAPGYHRLVFKTHPLEDGREPIPQLIKDAAKRNKISDRVQIIHGGKLGPMLDRATSAVTVNSTAGQQALWRGMPLRTFGRSVYSKPEFVSEQPLDEFFANPKLPDKAAYLDYRQFLLETSQISGGFYTAGGRAEVLRNIIDVILHNLDPYEERYRQRRLTKVWDSRGGS